MHIVEDKIKAPFALPGLGKRMKYLRRQCGLTAQNICDLTGINMSSLYHWENEKPQRTPGIEKVKQIVEILHASGAFHPEHKSRQIGHLLEYLFWGK